MLKVLDRVRDRLIKEADNEWPVTWEDVVEQGKSVLRQKKLRRVPVDLFSDPLLCQRMR